MTYHQDDSKNGIQNQYFGQSKSGSNGTSDSPIDRVIGRLSAGGYNPKPCGAGKWKSRCPAHDGSSHNLSVRLCDDGTVLLRCHHVDESGSLTCSADDIAAKLRLEMRDLFPPKAGFGPHRKPSSNGAKKGVPGSPPAKAKPKGAGYPSPEAAIAALAKHLGPATGSWVYLYADTDPAAIVVRFDPPGQRKEFRPIHRDAGDNLWRIGDPPGKWPLYWLACVDGAGRVYFPEGEKCVDYVRGLRLAAVTTAHGAESPHKSDLSPLAGREVVILLDVGPAGEGYGKRLTELLSKVDPLPTVKVVRLPGLVEDGDDIEQWIELRHSEGRTTEEIAAELEALADAAIPVGGSADDEQTTWTEDDAADIDEPTLAGEALGTHFHCTDLGNGERLVQSSGRDIRYMEKWKKWLVWDGRRWETDQRREINRRAKVAVRKIYVEAACAPTKDKRSELAEWAVASEHVSRLDAMIKCGSAEPGVAIVPDQLNAAPWLLNCLNGTIDLKTGELQPHRRDDYITQMCPVTFNADADCPFWLATMDLVFAGNRPVIDYFQKICGMLLAGDVSEQILPILWGSGENGKSTILNALMSTLGADYAMQAPNNFLMAKRHESHPTELASLFGKRLVVAIETGEGARINEVLIKQLTGSDKITARRMREDFWEFDPTHKVLLCTNHKPVIKGTDHAIWRRIKLIPFAVKIAADRKDKQMPAKLAKEASGILAWCLRGCLAWQRDGLEAPDEVVDATASYRAEEDLLARFIEENCTVLSGIRAKASALYTRFREWAEKANEPIISQRKFGEALGERGFESKNSNGVWYLDIGLRQEDGF